MEEKGGEDCCLYYLCSKENKYTVQSRKKAVLGSQMVKIFEVRKCFMGLVNKCVGCEINVLYGEGVWCDLIICLSFNIFAKKPKNKTFPISTFFHEL